MNPRVLKELDDITGRPLFIFERPSRFGEVPNGLEKAKCCTCLQKEQGLPKLLQAGGFTSGKSQKQVLLEAVSGHIEEKNVTGKTQHGFTRVIISTETGCGIPIIGGFQDLTDKGTKQPCLSLVSALL